LNTNITKTGTDTKKKLDFVAFLREGMFVMT